MQGLLSATTNITTITITITITITTTIRFVIEQVVQGESSKIHEALTVIQKGIPLSQASSAVKHQVECCK
jgi:hypothetical protein